ncbi:MAG: hypothetical protein ACRC5C_12590 [Bacilli bacterium]
MENTISPLRLAYEKCLYEVRKVEKHLEVINEDYGDSGEDFMRAFSLVKEIELTEQQLARHKEQLQQLEQQLKDEGEL